MRILLSILLCFGMLSPPLLLAQEAGNIARGFSSSDMDTRAIVLGLSSYQDTLYPPLPAGRQNAELFAAFLRTRGGGLLPASQVQLLTEQDATLGRFITALDRVREESRTKDHLLIYLSAYTKMFPGIKGEHPFLFFYDSPEASASAGALSLSEFLQNLEHYSNFYHLEYTVLMDLVILPQPQIAYDVWPRWMEAFSQHFPKAWAVASRGKRSADASLTRILLDGVMGPADWSGDGRVSFQEGEKYLKGGARFSRKGSVFLAATSLPHFLLSSTTPAPVKDPQNYYAQLQEMPSIISLEISRSEDSLLQKAGARAAQWHKDFILTMKLGHLIAPPGRCASDLYDSLASVNTLAPFHRSWRRKLAASLLDEAQQALNAYLKTDTREVFRRWKHSDEYDKYPLYLARANELLGHRHLMYRQLKTKQLYFEGLSARLDLERHGDSSCLETALEAQSQALAYEPQAAYVLNELGILYVLMRNDSAEHFFRTAISYAPRWSIPYGNLAMFFHDRMLKDSALHYGHEAVRLSPRNVIAMNNLGLIYGSLGALEDSERWLSQAIAMDDQYPDAQYNLACTKALQGKLEEALYWLERSLKSGFDDWRLIELDTHLSSLREHEKYPALIAKYRP